MLYSLCQRKPTINSLFFWGPPGGGGVKNSYYLYGSCKYGPFFLDRIQIIDHVNLWPPYPRGPQKIMNRLISLQLSVSVNLNRPNNKVGSRCKGNARTNFMDKHPSQPATQDRLHTIGPSTDNELMVGFF